MQGNKMSLFANGQKVAVASSLDFSTINEHQSNDDDLWEDVHTNKTWTAPCFFSGKGESLRRIKKAFGIPTIRVCRSKKFRKTKKHLKKYVIPSQYVGRTICMTTDDGMQIEAIITDAKPHFKGKTFISVSIIAKQQED